MTFEEKPASIAPPIGTIKQKIDYSILKQKWGVNFDYDSKYRQGQFYIIDSNSTNPYQLIDLIITAIFDELQKAVKDPEQKLIIENHYVMIQTTIKNLKDLKISIDPMHILCIIDGIIYANGQQHYKKEY